MGPLSTFRNSLLAEPKKPYFYLLRFHLNLLLDHEIAWNVFTQDKRKKKNFNSRTNTNKN